MLDKIYNWLLEQVETFSYDIYQDNFDLLSNSISIIVPPGRIDLGVKYGDRVRFLSPNGQTRHGSLIIKDIDVQAILINDRRHNLETLLFDCPISIGVPGVCKDDGVFVQSYSYDLIKIRKILNFIMNGV